MDSIFEEEFKIVGRHKYVLLFNIKVFCKISCYCNNILWRYDLQGVPKMDVQRKMRDSSVMEP